MRRKVNDNGLIIILLIIIIAAAIAALIMAFRHWDTSIYERRMKAESAARVALMRAVNPPPGYVVYGVYMKTGEVLMRRVETITTPDEVEQQENDEAHDLAVRLISDSIATFGHEATKLLPANQWSSAAQWDMAVKHLLNRGLVMTSNKGTLIKIGDLRGLMVALAVSGLSPTPTKAL